MASQRAKRAKRWPNYIDESTGKTLKRPRTSYASFLAAETPRYWAENPNSTFGEVASVMAKRWTELSQETKAVSCYLSFTDI